MAKLLLYGLQRSGTNFLERILLKNFEVEFLNSNEHRNHPVQKHFRLYDDKHLITPRDYRNDHVFDGFEAFEKALPEPADGYVVISKDPYAWALSYRSWANKCKWPKVDFHPAAEWEAFYGKWLDFSHQTDRIQFVRYVDLLSRSEHVLGAVARRFGIDADEESVVGALDRVPQSGAFTDERKRYYVEQEYLGEMRDTEIAAINHEVSERTLIGLGYERHTASAASLSA